MEEDARFKSIQVNQSLFKPVSKYNDVEAIYIEWMSQKCQWMWT